MKNTSLATQSLSPDSLSPITYNGVPVVTTELLARLYGTQTNNIKVNHSRNYGRFIEGKHYFKITGQELKNLRVTLSNPQNPVPIHHRARSLVLWTERGAARHAKMLDTDQAWEVFERLEDCYFNVAPAPVDHMSSDLLPSTASARMAAWSYADDILRRCNEFASGKGIDIKRWDAVDADKMADGLLMDVLSRHRIMISLNHRFELMASLTPANELAVSPRSAASVNNLVGRIDSVPVLEDMLKAGITRMASLKK